MIQYKNYSLLETFTDKFNIIQDDWNGFNVLQLTASRVGALDAGFFQKSRSLDDTYKDARNGKYKIVLAGVGADEINYKEFKNCQIAYIGITDRGQMLQYYHFVAAYTEKDAICTHRGDSISYLKAFLRRKEDWKIINQISEFLELDGLLLICQM